MDLRLTPEQAQLVDSFSSLYGKAATPDQVRAAEPLGFDKGLWDRLGDIGAVAMAVDEEHGGWGASLLDLVLIAEQHGRFVAPAPLVEAQVAARALSRCEGRVGADALAAALADNRLVTFAVRPSRDGIAGMVPAAAVADDAVIFDRDRLVLVTLEGRRTAVDNFGSMPVADVDVPHDAEVLASGPGARTLFESMLDDWLVLTAAALVGIGARALEIGVDYVSERRAWGVPIGTFQAISHRLADSATALDGARLLTYEAAWAAGNDPAHSAELAALAFAFATEAARDGTYRSLHFHGGYGFMMEYDVQLYWRRARAWGAVYANADKAFERAADQRYGPTRMDGTA